MEYTIFWIAIAANCLILFGVLYTYIGASRTQFWPPPAKNTWQFQLLWWSVRVIVLSIVILSYLEWETINLSAKLRYWVALPIFVVTFSLGSMAALNLGWKNTHGIEDGFVERGFYRLSRNPQYVLFSFSFVALSFFIAGPKTMVLLWLLAAVYLIAPFPEERWLEEKYGQQYLNYKHRVPRYF